MISLATETERTLFFDFLPLDLGTVRGFRTRLHLYTVPGQVMYERTRTAVLSGADGVVFVADSEQNRLDEDAVSLQELSRNLQKQGKRMQEYPIILQYNKRDLATAAPLPTLESYLNAMNWPHYEATATQGTGVLETLKAISQMVISKL